MKNELIEKINKIDNTLHLDNNQVVGLTDSDGNFGVWHHVDKFSPIFLFKVSLRDYSVKLLIALLSHFKVGKIRLENEATGSLMYAVTNRKELREVIIPFLISTP